MITIKRYKPPMDRGKYHALLFEESVELNVTGLPWVYHFSNDEHNFGREEFKQRVREFLYGSFSYTKKA